jgi:predicted amidohydrolase YtcJ
MRALAILFFGATVNLQAEVADTIFLNGNVYTVNEKQPRAEAVTVKADRIIFVGSNADARKLRGEHTRVIDWGGRTVVPGLTDSHCHIFEIGEREMTLNLEGTNSLEDFLAKVRERVSRPDRDKWITGRGWIETFWKPPQFPTRGDLDKIAPDNPVFLTRADGHAAIANSLALKIVNITRDSPNPFGGEILKDKNSEPTGMLLDNAQDLVASKIPKPTEMEREQALLVGVRREIELGWCEIQNAGSELDDQRIMRRGYEANRIKLRIYNAAYGPGPAANELLENGAMLNAFDHHFTQRAIKVIFDGALGSRGAALLAPYADQPQTSGYLTQKSEALRPMFDRALQRGIQVETHAIGDRANRIILDLYEEALKRFLADKHAVLNPRWRVEHAQILSQQDISRFSELRVIASMQPSHAISDLFFAPARLGMERLAGAYAWNSLLKTGTIICGGSDAPVERGEPMIEFYAAVTRKSIRGEQCEGWHPEQAVTREQALKMFTINAAYAAFEENDKGTIEPGKLADFTVFSADIMKIPGPEMLSTQCEMTVIGGEILHRAYEKPAVNSPKNTHE